jgi:hypothetical protein
LADSADEQPEPIAKKLERTESLLVTRGSSLRVERALNLNGRFV